MKRHCRRLLLLKRLRDTERGDKMKVIWESDLQIEKMCSSAERAILCQKSRGFKATIEKEEKHEKMLDAVSKGIGDLLLGALIFGGMTAALYYGSI